MKKTIIIATAALTAVVAVAGYCVYRSNWYSGKRVCH